ncbi:MAG: 16S rRNA (cytidine(1402)-2'-O)-methyltransferase [bacterium]
MTGSLFVCGTPIGNLDDTSIRLIQTLKEVSLIAAEDTRVTKKLTVHFQITTPIISYHAHSSVNKIQNIISELKRGRSIALVTDAGTPGISDPGEPLIKAAINEGINIIPIPGPSAVAAALSISGFPTSEFSFVGFLPRKPGKIKKLFEKLKHEGRTVVFYESPYRIVKTMAFMLEVLGDVEICVCRELTKKFEEIYRGKIADISAKIRPQGEFTVVFSIPDQE